MGVRQTSRKGSTTVRLGAVLATLALVAAACGSSGKGGGGTATTGGKAVRPKMGGSLTIGTEAEVTTGFDPFNSYWDATGLSYAATVYDPLTALADDGTFKPYLAESLTPNADYTAWKIKARSGITFSDGEPFNGDAMLLDFQSLLKSPLTGPVLNNIQGVSKVDDMTIEVDIYPKAHCPTCGPWTVFPQYMASQLGMMVAPNAIRDAGNLAHHPIGTGPFIFKEWNVGNHFTATRNPNYWRKDAYGNPLPYLDSVTFKPLVDTVTRENSLKSGTIDMMHTSDSQNVVDFRGDNSVHLIEQKVGRVEEDFFMINVRKPPLDDIRIRRALAMGLNQEKYNQVINNGIDKLANGPYSDGSGFPNAPGYPKYDQAGARALVDAYKADHHLTSVTFEFGTTNNGRNLQANNLVADMWSQIGLSPHVVQIEQSSYIANAVTGNFQVYGWRQFGEPDPDGDAVWWASDKALPPLQTNFAGNRDPQIDADLAAARETLDQAKRKQLYLDISAQFNKDIPYIWTNQVLWAYVAQPKVQGIEGRTLVDGSPGRSLLSGVIVPTQLWVSQ